MSHLRLLKLEETPPTSIGAAAWIMVGFTVGYAAIVLAIITVGP